MRTQLQNGTLSQKGLARNLPRPPLGPRGRRCDALQGVSEINRQSLIPQTLTDMEADVDLQQHLNELKLKGIAEMTREERIRRQRALDKLDVPSFTTTCKEKGVSSLSRGLTTTLQLNIGLYCNQACTHCHVESSPKRTEMMDRKTAEACVRLMKSKGVETVDITGGAPELNAQFRYLVTEARAIGLTVIDRCNLTVLLEPGQEDLGTFLAENQVQVVASLPCYAQKNVDQQRGAGVFERSIEALQMLNALGYGQPGSSLRLDLVYNPSGASLAPSQAKLEVAYKQELLQMYGIEFNSLFCLNNMPIKRFADFLQRRGQMEAYLQLLVSNFNPQAAEGIMCRNTISVGWDGRIYDCDFNQQLEMMMMIEKSVAEGTVSEISLDSVAAKGMTVFDIANLDDLSGKSIRIDNHCFGCTAGSGSSCTGAVA